MLVDLTVINQVLHRFGEFLCQFIILYSVFALWMRLFLSSFTYVRKYTTIFEHL